MKIISILYSIAGVVVSTSYDLEESNDGLLVRMPLHPGGEVYSFFVDTRSSMSVHFPAVVGVLPIGPESPFGIRASALMLLPPTNTHESFRLIESVQDPNLFCDGGTMGIAEMTAGHAITFSASLSLVFGEQAVGQNITSVREQYAINTRTALDIIPREIYTALSAEVERIGVQSEYDENMALLPSLEYTIYNSASSTDIVARIVIYPSDYIVFGPDGPLLMVRPSTQPNRARFGLNALEYMGILLDYQHNRIGFCEPI